MELAPGVFKSADHCRDIRPHWPESARRRLESWPWFLINGAHGHESARGFAEGRTRRPRSGRRSDERSHGVRRNLDALRPKLAAVAQAPTVIRPLPAVLRTELAAVIEALAAVTGVPDATRPQPTVLQTEL